MRHFSIGADSLLSESNKEERNMVVFMFSEIFPHYFQGRAIKAEMDLELLLFIFGGRKLKECLA